MRIASKYMGVLGLGILGGLVLTMWWHGQAPGGESMGEKDSVWQESGGQTPTRRYSGENAPGIGASNEEMFDLGSEWRGRLEKGEFVVRAGVARGQPRDGVVVVTLRVDERGGWEQATYRNPGVRGKLDVVQVSGEDVMLRAENGEVWHLDVMTGSYRQ